MARHIWLTKKFRPTDAPVAVHTPIAMMIALEYGLDLRETCRFVGYYCERSRQDGSPRPVHPSKRSTYHTGKNAENYLEVGRRLVQLHLGYFHPSLFDEGTVGAQLLADLADNPLADWLADHDTTLLALVTPADTLRFRQEYHRLAQHTYEGVPPGGVPRNLLPLNVDLIPPELEFAYAYWECEGERFMASYVYKV